MLFRNLNIHNYPTLEVYKTIYLNSRNKNTLTLGQETKSNKVNKNYKYYVEMCTDVCCWFVDDASILLLQPRQYSNTNKANTNYKYYIEMCTDVCCWFVNDVSILLLQPRQYSNTSFILYNIYLWIIKLCTRR